MSKLLEEILSDENVELALEKVKAKKGKSGELKYLSQMAGYVNLEFRLWRTV